MSVPAADPGARSGVLAGVSFVAGVAGVRLGRGPR
jgi:hypothetical protein